MIVETSLCRLSPNLEPSESKNIAEEAITLAELRAAREWPMRRDQDEKRPINDLRPAGEYYWLGIDRWAPHARIYRWPGAGRFAPPRPVERFTPIETLHINYGWPAEDLTFRCQGVLLGGGLALLLDHRDNRPYVVMTGDPDEYRAMKLARGWQEALYTIELRHDAPKKIKELWSSEIGAQSWRHTWPGEGGR